MFLLDVAFGRGTAVVLALAIAPVLALPGDAPERGRVVVTDTETTILDVIEFTPGTAVLRPNSRPTLDAVAATLSGNPSIELVEVQSHTPGTGDSTANLALSEQRAAVVVSYLVDAGVEPARLVPEGYGDSQPIVVGAPTRNERMSFLILRRSSDAE